MEVLPERRLASFDLPEQIGVEPQSDGAPGKKIGVRVIAAMRLQAHALMEQLHTGHRRQQADGESQADGGRYRNKNPRVETGLRSGGSGRSGGHQIPDAAQRENGKKEGPGLK